MISRSNLVSGKICGSGQNRTIVGVVGLAHDLDRPLRYPTLELHVMDLSAEMHPHLELFAEEVDGRDAHAVEPRRHLVAPAAELAAGVQARQHQFEGGNAFLLVDVHRDAAPVVFDLDAPVGVKRDGDPGRIPGESLVDRVVHHLVDQVVEAARGGGPDVHARAPPDMLPALEDLDLLGGVRDVRA